MNKHLVPYRLSSHPFYFSNGFIFFPLFLKIWLTWSIGQYIFSKKCFLRNMLLISSQTFINTGFFQWKHFFFRIVPSVIPPFLFQWRLYFFPFVSQDLIDMVNTYFRRSVFWGTCFLLAPKLPLTQVFFNENIFFPVPYRLSFHPFYFSDGFIFSPLFLKIWLTWSIHIFGEVFFEEHASY